MPMRLDSVRLSGRTGLFTFAHVGRLCKRQVSFALSAHGIPTPVQLSRCHTRLDPRACVGLRRMAWGKRYTTTGANDAPATPQGTAAAL